MAASLGHGPGSKRNNNLGPYGKKAGVDGGKGNVISSTFGDRWVKNTEERLSKRRYACTSCGTMKPSGECEKCGHNPYPKGW